MADAELIERITADHDDPSWPGHEARYRLAAGYIDQGDAVLDAACGVGYGAAFAPHAAAWTGVDIVDVVGSAFRPLGRWIVADLCEWEPDESYDVAISFETIEHVADPAHLIDTLCQARRLVVCSVPIVPTAGANPFHLHDFTMWTLPPLFEARGWRLRQFLLQPSELSGIYVFAR